MARYLGETRKNNNYRWYPLYIATTPCSLFSPPLLPNVAEEVGITETFLHGEIRRSSKTANVDWSMSDNVSALVHNARPTQVGEMPAKQLPASTIPQAYQVAVSSLHDIQEERAVFTDSIPANDDNSDDGDADNADIVEADDPSMVSSSNHTLPRDTIWNIQASIKDPDPRSKLRSTASMPSPPLEITGWQRQSISSEATAPGTSSSSTRASQYSQFSAVNYTRRPSTPPPPPPTPPIRSRSSTNFWLAREWIWRYIINTNNGRMKHHTRSLSSTTR